MVFGPKPRDFGKKVSKATRKLALRKAISERLKAGDVVIVDEFKLDAPKTKEFLGILSALQLEGTVLLVTPQADEKLALASRNVQNVERATSDSLNTFQVLKSDKLVFTRSAFEKVGERLSQQ